MQLQVINSPFSQEQVDLLNQLLPTLSGAQQVWLSGYLTAQAVNVAMIPAATVPDFAANTALQNGQILTNETQNGGVAPSLGDEAKTKEVTILYGSQTGNCQRLAEQFAVQLKEQSYQVQVAPMNEFKTNQLKKINHLLIVVSTHGEGDPPDNAISFYEFLHSKRAPKLEHLSYSVLGLGDTSYEFFCQTAVDFDTRLEELGAQRLSARIDCDLDYDDDAAQWFETILEKLNELTSQSDQQAQPAAASAGAAAMPGIGAANGQSLYAASAQQPFAVPSAVATLSPPMATQQAVAALPAFFQSPYAFQPQVAVMPNGAAATAVAEPKTESSIYSRKNPFYAEVLENINLNGRGSDQETRHIELSIEGANFQFEPGDCLGILPENDPELVDALIETMSWDADEPIVINNQGEEQPLREALLHTYEITVLTKRLLEQLATISFHDDLKKLVEPGQEERLKQYIEGRDLLDLVQDFSPWKGSASEFIAMLRKMPPRLYSIASSQLANPDEVHLTIRAVRYEAHGRQRHGVCSIQCAERVQIGDTLPVYIHHNPNFKLPADPDAPIIMIGPGTGVAPFRAFLEEREELGAEGKTWLFFGDRRFSTDFLYQVDWQRWLKEGVLTKMDVAFSRDTPNKVYVQHRMLENSKELFQWLEDGAYVYICGDEKRMAHDVHETLLSIIEQEGNRSREDAKAYLNEMQQQKRYQRDVY